MLNAAVCTSSSVLFFLSHNDDLLFDEKGSKLFSFVVNDSLHCDAYVNVKCDIVLCQGGGYLRMAITLKTAGAVNCVTTSSYQVSSQQSHKVGLKLCLSETASMDLVPFSDSCLTLLSYQMCDPQVKTVNFYKFTHTAILITMNIFKAQCLCVQQIDLSQWSHKHGVLLVRFCKLRV